MSRNRVFAGQGCETNTAKIQRREDTKAHSAFLQFVDCVAKDVRYLRWHQPGEPDPVELDQAQQGQDGYCLRPFMLLAYTFRGV
jgi:hypothetical protein